MNYIIRKATMDDCGPIEKLIGLSARGLSPEYTSGQVEAALLGAFGVDTVLISDQTYFVAEAGSRLVGCGGWSKRKTLFGGDSHTTRDSALLDPTHEAAKIRAFFIHPAWARQGIARTILSACEAEAAAHGFTSLELMSTLPGEKLYTACGFEKMEPVKYTLSGGVEIEFVPMKKRIQF
ncbi:MAG TPA: GNAT family N-acetyltransferase [Bacteroidota bacterium]|nr:GNAT family N-acetyltransferase [Bacteroidota bacterium]